MRQNALMLAAPALPRSIRQVRAQGAPSVDQVIAGLEEFKKKHEKRYDEIEAAIDAQAAAIAAGRLNGGINSDKLAIDREYTNAFTTFLRQDNPAEAKGFLAQANQTGQRGAIQAAMSEGNSTSGGYLAPVEWDRTIRQSQRPDSPIRRIANIILTTNAAFQTMWSDDLLGSGWVGETASRPSTTTPSFGPLTFPAGEIYANPAITQRMLDDAAVDLEKWAGDAIGRQFGREEAIAFVAGNGVNKPMGFLQYVPGGAAAAAVLDGGGNVVTPAAAGAHPGGNLTLVPSGSASKVDNADALISMAYKLAGPYRQNAVWVMNSNTAAAVSKLKNAQGDYLWRDSLIAGQPPTLLGKPVELDENMPDIDAGSLPMAFGDFNRGYLINDRAGISILKDPFTNKGFVNFYATRRVGGGLLDNKAIVVMKVAAS